ncbi:hypothetical protein GYH30_029279 [Glycine max]|nr:hypothetical protein GYH30_029279 [Glycine max]
MPSQNGQFQYLKFSLCIFFAHPKYYDGDYNMMLKILVGCKETGCTFLVGGRNVDGAFKVLDDIDVPEELKGMVVSIQAEQFRMDISSTEIRNRNH